MNNGFITFSCKKVVFIKLTIEFAVEEMVFLGRFETDALHRRGVGRDDPRGSPCKLVFEGRTDGSIEVLHLFVGMETLAVRGIEHHQRGGPTLGLLRREGIRTLDFLDADLFEFDIFLHTGSFDILGSLLDGIERGIGSVYLMGKVALVTIVVVDITPEVGIEIGPFLKGVRRTKDTRGDVTGDEGSASMRKVPEPHIGS